MTKSEAGRQKNQNFHSEELQGLKNIETMKTWVRIPQLTSFFLYNEQHPDGINNQVTYMDFPSRFAWKKDVRQWSLRQNQNPGMKLESISALNITLSVAVLPRTILPSVPAAKVTIPTK